MRGCLQTLPGHSHGVQDPGLSIHRVPEDLHLQDFGVSLERDRAGMLRRRVELFLPDLSPAHRSRPRVIEESETGILTGCIDL